MRKQPTLPSDTLTVITWPDEVIDKLGHDPRSNYVETYWLGVLGPSTSWLLRYLASELEVQPSGFRLDLPQCARRLGLGMRGGRDSPFMRSLGRLVQFEMAQLHGSNVLAVRRRVPTLSRRHLQKLSDDLRAQHDEWALRQLETA